MVFSLCPNKLLLVFLYFNMGYILTWVLALSYNSQAKIKPHIHCNYINSLLGLVATFLECDRLKKLILNVCSRGLEIGLPVQNCLLGKNFEQETFTKSSLLTVAQQMRLVRQVLILNLVLRTQGP